MDHDRAPAESSSSSRPSEGSMAVHDPEASAHAPLTSRSTHSSEVILSGGTTEHNMPSHQATFFQDPPEPGPSLPFSTDVTATAPFTSGQGPSVPASRSNGSPPRPPHWNATQQTSLSFEEGDRDRRLGPPLPPLPHDLRARNSRIGIERPLSPGPRSGIDYIVPIDEKATREKTVGERLHPTLATAILEKDKYAFKAKMTGYALNLAIGVQVLLGALTTGLSAVTTGRGLATLTASYLARARGSNEPELSITRVKDLEQFIRECEAFKMDHGHTLGGSFDNELEEFRRRFEELLGNANG
ncbi:hypothetical protein C0991_008058 [Blastosporella zonata]|nr:hypothetical protein C0991_008058 [Blastosporella zonata]